MDITSVAKKHLETSAGYIMDTPTPAKLLKTKILTLYS